MFFKVFHSLFSFWVAVGLLFVASCNGMAASDPAMDPSPLAANEPVLVTGVLYNQPVDPSGKLLLSAWLDPDGSDLDQYIWDNFTLQSNETISEIQWFGLYDPIKFGAGGPVADFQVSIYPSIAAGTEPAVAGAPLVEYRVGGNAAEAPIGTIGGATLYSYSFSLPTAFVASAGVKYWVQIEAFQHGSIPDWCLAAGSGGDGNHFQRGAGAGGDILYRLAPGDAAFTLLGPVPEVPTPTDAATNTPAQTPPSTATSTPTETPTSTSTSTPTDTATATRADTPTDIPTSTAIDMPTSSPTYTPTDTPTGIPTSTLTDTATSTPTPTPLTSTPGKVTGGGVIDPGRGGNQLTFGFVVDFHHGDDAPKGNLIYQDHQMNLRVKAISFDLLLIEGNHVWITGIAIVNDGSVANFTVQIDTDSEPGSQDTFTISIPAWDGYTAGGALTGGNITIH